MRVVHPNESAAKSPPRRSGLWLPLCLGLGLVAGAAATVATSRWWQPYFALAAASSAASAEPEADYPGMSLAPAVDAPPGEEHAEGDGHDHGSHEDHDANMLKVSEAALKNVKAKFITLALRDYEQVVTIPGVIVERQGRTRMDVPAPLAGVVTKIYRTVGQSVKPGEPLFDIQLRDDALVAAQSEFLLTIEQTKVVQKELDRLSSVGSDVVAKKQVLEREYEKQTLQAKSSALRQRLLLEGLTEEQVAAIEKSAKLISEITVSAPTHPGHIEGDEAMRPSHMQAVFVTIGQRVVSGTSLACVADHSELFIEGSAFEGDAPKIAAAAEQKWPMSARVPGSPDRIPDLKFLYSADMIDQATRAIRFYVQVPNEIVPTSASDEGFVEWRFKPGRRVEIDVPTKRLTQQIVVPADAVAKEGADTFVFVKHKDSHGEHFDRTPVHVVFQDGREAVIAKDGPLKPGQEIVGNGAYQMHLALKNAAGGGVDPHAGHSH